MSRAISERARAELWARVPEGRPFTALEGTELGISVHWLRTWACQGRLRRPVRGVYVRLGVRDTLDLRLQVLRLVVPPDCVVTDRTAAWLWGAPMVLAPGDHLQAPRVSVFAPPGRRLRNDLSRSGERMFSTEDVVARDGVLVTTPLRTACDVLRLLHRDQAIAVSDMLASVGAFEVERLSSELVRFKGYRGVIQARALAPLIDAGSGSPGESILRMRWYDAGLPRPTSQVEVAAPGGSYFVDLGLPRVKFGAEYFGEEFHGTDEAEHDASRLRWIRDIEAWTVVVIRKEHLFGQHQNAELQLRSAYKRLMR